MNIKNTLRNFRVTYFAATVAMGCSVSMAASAHSVSVIPPVVPSTLQVPAGNKPFFEYYALGTQDYICLPSATGFSWTFFGPQATLFNDEYRQVATHFLSPNPAEGGTLRPTWQHSQDTSAVWAKALNTSSDAAFVASGAIPWLLLQVVGTQDGPTHGNKLASATFLQRVATAGGVAPASGCEASTDVGKKVLVPYSATYVFYRTSK